MNVGRNGGARARRWAVCGLAALEWLAGPPVATAQKQMGKFNTANFSKKGVIEWRISGASYQMLADGNVRIRDICIEVFNKDGILDVRLTAPECVVNQARQTAASDGAVRIERGNMVVTGEGFQWNGGSRVVTILKRVTQTTTRAREDGGLEALK